MNIRLNVLYLGGVLVVASGLARPVLADEWNKRTEFQFSKPVEIPGRVLTAGKYVFQLADSQSDRDIVQIFSEDSSGKDTLVATLLAIPDYMEDTPDKPIVHFEERRSGSPEAIRSWFYPGENTGWAFVYTKSQPDSSMSTTPAATSAADTAAPALTEPPQIQAAEPVAEESRAIYEEVTIAQNDSPATLYAQQQAVPLAPEEVYVTATPDPVLPQTAGYSGMELVTGLTALTCGMAIVFTAVRKSVA